jgi:DNA invertase Pin-like site-specific DNA recombinase
MATRRNKRLPRRKDARGARGHASVEKDAPGPRDLETNTPVDAPLPRPKRRRRRARADRGLPPDEELAKLATAYLEKQRKLWPKLVQAGLVPEPSEGIIREMVDDFKYRHRTGSVDVEAVRPFAKAAHRLGGSYNRYSCDKSSPTSILDQVVNELDKAHDEGRFVPWHYVFADYSVTGLDPCRQGYTSYKKILAAEDHLIETTYIDDFTRASRDEIEWWRLASLSKRLNKRMIGASDGFDLSDPNSDLLITMFGLVSRLFIKSTREKSRRGMKGAARRGTCLGKLSLGFTRRVHRDEHGNIAYRPDGLPRKEPCIDPATKGYRELLYELFTEKNWSPYKIARHFNKLRVDDWDGWTNTAIRNLLWSSTAIGVFIWNRTRREYDWEEGKMVKVKNPRSEWEVRYDPDLAIVPMERWRAARRKLASTRRRSPLTGRKPSRNQISATTLFSGALYCEYCLDHGINDAEIKLIRSTSKYKQMGCLNGMHRTHGCQLSSSKSTRIIEECLLEYIRNAIFTEAALEDLIIKANAYLEEEAQKPQVDTAAMKAEARKLEAKIKKLVTRVEDEPDEGLCAAYDKRIKELQKDLRPLNEQIREANRQNRRRVVEPLDLDRAKAYLADLRGLLNQEIPAAAEAIRTLTGPIKVRQKPIPGRKRGARWIATFSPDLVRLLRHLARDKEYPESVVLADAKLPEPATVELKIEKVPKYEGLAPKFKQLRDNGERVQSIADAHGMTWQAAAEVLHFAYTGERPVCRNGATMVTGPKPYKYAQFAPDVAKLRDKQGLSWLRISATLGVSEKTVKRAYDHHHREAVRQSPQHGDDPVHKRDSHLDDGLDDEADEDQAA